MNIHKWYDLGEDLFAAELDYKTDSEWVKEFAQEAREKGELLAVVYHYASNAGRLIWALEQDKNISGHYFRISLDALYWNFRTVLNRGIHRVKLNDEEAFELTGPVKQHFLMGFLSWYPGLELAAVFRRQDVIEELLKAPEAFLFGPGISWDDESYLDYRFMKAFWTDDPALPEIHRRLLEVLDPKKCESESALLNLQNYSLPMAELYGRIIHRDQEGFDRALVAALEGNIRNNLPDPEGDVNHFALVPTHIIAAAVIARDSGMQINLETPYLPKWMLEGDF